MKVNYYGPFARETGYSRAAQDYMECLLAAGVDLNILPIIDGKESILEERYHNLLPYVNREDAKDPAWADVVICHAIPYGLDLFLSDPQVSFSGVKRVGITTWETSKMPGKLAHSVGRMLDQVWVPSNFSRNAFFYNACGCQEDDHDVRVVPHSIDKRFWEPKNSRTIEAEYGYSKDPYIFYTILTWAERKNPIGLLKAYLTEFTEEDNVLLRIRTPDYNAKEIEELARGLQLDYLPPVEMICERLTEQQLLDLHYTSDCYVTCSRAEGWGLGAFEAAALGKPVIATDFSGFKDFLEDYNNRVLLPCFWTPAYTPQTVSDNVLEIAGLSIKPVSRNDHTGIQGNQSWAEPDLGSLKEFMRDFYYSRERENPTEGFKILDKYSYEKVGAIMKQNLEDLFK